MYSWGYYILSLTMVVVAIWIVKKFLDMFFEKKKLNLLGISIWSIYIFFQILVEINKGNASAWTTIIGMVLVFLISIICYYKPGQKNIFVVILFYVVWAIVEMIVYFGLDSVLLNKQYFSIIGVVVSKVVMIIIINFLSLFSERRYDEFMATRYYVMLLLVPFGSIYIAINQFFMMSDSEYIFSSMIIFSILLLLNIIIFEIYFKLCENSLHEKEHIVYAKQLESISKTTEEQKKFMEDFHRERHNWINELIVLKNSMENDEKVDVIENMNRIINTYDIGEKHLKCGNNIVDAIINFKYTFAVEQGIEFITKIFIPDVLPINQCDIGVILGNAIDNSIEAVMNCKSHNKVINIRMGIKKEALIIVVSNPYEHILKINKFGNLISTKNEYGGHGYGVSSIKKVAEKYSGDVILNIDDDLFTITIILNLMEF